MVEAIANTDTSASATTAPTNLNIAPVDKANALGLFREAELNTHVDIVLAAYIAEAVKIAQVSDYQQNRDFL